jgi:hypothetical protein
VDSLSRNTSQDEMAAAGFGPQPVGDHNVDRRARRGRRPVAYLVLPNVVEPFLLARVRWPDVFQAISPVRPDWQDDPGLFDLPYSPAGFTVSRDEATRLAELWGARLPSEEEDQVSGPSLIRRMPSDWANLSMAEKRAWSIVVRKTRRGRLGRRAVPAAVIDLTDESLADRQKVARA